MKEGNEIKVLDVAQMEATEGAGPELTPEARAALVAHELEISLRQAQAECGGRLHASLKRAGR